MPSRRSDEMAKLVIKHVETSELKSQMLPLSLQLVENRYQKKGIAYGRL